MAWPFSPRKTRPRGRVATIEMIYGTIVAQARLPEFYLFYGVPDTVNARFDMVVLHLWMALRRLRALGEEDVAQHLFDHFCSDLDGNLREMGVGDLVVPKRMTKFGEAFYGRTQAYDRALAEGGQALCDALSRNIVKEGMPAAPLAAYVKAALVEFDRMDAGALLAGEWRLPAPPPIPS